MEWLSKVREAAFFYAPYAILVNDDCDFPIEVLRYYLSEIVDKDDEGVYQSIKIYTPNIPKMTIVCGIDHGRAFFELFELSVRIGLEPWEALAKIKKMSQIAAQNATVEEATEEFRKVIERFKAKL
jgi:hypothetical protein